MINNYNAYSFADLINIISAIGDSARKEERVPPVLWFRGHIYVRRFFEKFRLLI